MHPQTPSNSNSSNSNSHHQTPASSASTAPGRYLQRRSRVRRSTVFALVLALLWSLPLHAQSPGAVGATGAQATADKPPRMGRNLPTGKPLREMQIHPVKAIGLEVWVENQPPWETQIVQNGGRSVFAVSSPENYHPPAAMTYASWPEHAVSEQQLSAVAHSALRHAAQNFGLAPGQARALQPRAAQHGLLQGYEVEFVGKVQATAVDVRLFFGLQPGRAPVVMTVYTLQGKIDHLKEVVRRSWDNISYLE